MADEERLVDLARRLEAGIEVVRRKTSNSLKLEHVSAGLNRGIPLKL